MTRKQLSSLLLANGQAADPVAGYNYSLFAIRTGNPDVVIEILRQQKGRIEQTYQRRAVKPLHLLPVVALRRASSVLLPLPAETSVNVVAGILRGLRIPDASIPFWR